MKIARWLMYYFCWTALVSALCCILLILRPMPSSLTPWIMCTGTVGWGWVPSPLVLLSSTPWDDWTSTNPKSQAVALIFKIVDSIYSPWRCLLHGGETMVLYMALCMSMCMCVIYSAIYSGQQYRAKTKLHDFSPIIILINRFQASFRYSDLLLLHISVCIS